MNADVSNHIIEAIPQEWRHHDFTHLFIGLIHRCSDLSHCHDLCFIRDETDYPVFTRCGTIAIVLKQLHWRLRRASLEWNNRSKYNRDYSHSGSLVVQINTSDKVSTHPSIFVGHRCGARIWS
jgi:hypothetical protein